MAQDERRTGGHCWLLLVGLIHVVVLLVGVAVCRRCGWQLLVERRGGTTAGGRQRGWGRVAVVLDAVEQAAEGLCVALGDGALDDW
jgi:hypothetical protein